MTVSEKTQMSEEMREMLIKLIKICNRAARNAHEENRRLGIPNVYSINGIMVYEYKGTISMTPPPEWEAFNPAEHAGA